MARAERAGGCVIAGYGRGGAIRPRPGAVLYHLGLGANLGDRAGQLERALAFLGSCGRVLKRSSVYETTPLDMPGSGMFLNMAVALESELAPLALLRACKAHEAAQGRDPANSHNRDRAIDIDILFAGGTVIATPELTVPHPRLCQRGFVLVPLFEIAPRLVHPVEKLTVARLLARLQGGGKVVRLG